MPSAGHVAAQVARRGPDADLGVQRQHVLLVLLRRLAQVGAPAERGQAAPRLRAGAGRGHVSVRVCRNLACGVHELVHAQHVLHGVARGTARDGVRVVVRAGRVHTVNAVEDFAPLRRERAVVAWLGQPGLHGVSVVLYELLAGCRSVRPDRLDLAGHLGGALDLLLLDLVGVAPRPRQVDLRIALAVGLRVGGQLVGAVSFAVALGVVARVALGPPPARLGVGAPLELDLGRALAALDARVGLGHLGRVVLVGGGLGGMQPLRLAACLAFTPRAAVRHQLEGGGIFRRAARLARRRHFELYGAGTSLRAATP